MLCFAQAELIQYAPRYPKQIFHFVLCLLVDSISKMQYVIFNFYQVMFPTPNLLNLHCMYFFFDMLKFNPFYSGASFSPIIFLISSFLVRLISFYIIFKHMHHGISWISAISCTYSWRIIGTKRQKQTFGAIQLQQGVQTSPHTDYHTVAPIHSSFV